jgi:hypothetical protein
MGFVHWWTQIKRTDRAVFFGEVGSISAAQKPRSERNNPSAVF